MVLDFANVSLLYPTQPADTFTNLTLQFAKGWTGLLAPHGRGKTTLLRLAAGDLEATSGRIRRPGAARYLSPLAQEPPHNLEELLQTPDRVSAQLVGRLDLNDDFAARWETLSASQRKRAQVACALWEDPAILALDEPTGHLDAATRHAIAAVLANFRGIGLLASHDRELLNRLCSNCLDLAGEKPILRAGSYARARTAILRDQETLRRQQANARRELDALAATVEDRRREASQANAKRSKRFLDPGDSDARQKLDRARKSGKDGRAGHQLKQLQGRLAQAEQRATAFDIAEAACLPPHFLGEALPIDAPSPWTCEPHVLPLDNDRALTLPALEIGKTARIGITGPLHCGKSALLRHILATAGEQVRILHLPQAFSNETPVSAPALLSADAQETLLFALHHLDDEQQAAILAAANSFNANLPSLPAESPLAPDVIIKLALAHGLSRRPQLILLDEPTTTFDLPSIEALEQSLATLRCALVIISHDQPLLDALTTTRWQITAADTGQFTLTVPTPAT